MTQIWEEDGVLWSQEVMTRVCVRGDLTRTTNKLENKLKQQSARWLYRAVNCCYSPHYFQSWGHLPGEARAVRPVLRGADQTNSHLESGAGPPPAQSQRWIQVKSKLIRDYQKKDINKCQFLYRNIKCHIPKNNNCFRLTLHAAKTLYESSIAFGARQGGQAVQQNGDLQEWVATISKLWLISNAEQTKVMDGCNCIAQLTN